MYVLQWRTVSTITQVLFWYLFPELLRNSGNKHQNNPLVSAETVRHSSTYIIAAMNTLRLDEAYASVNWVIIGSDKGWLPMHHQAITWATDDLLSIGHVEQTSAKFLLN